MSRRRLPEVFYNWISAAGALVVVTSASVIALLILIDLVVEQTTLYLGLLTYVLLPGVLAFGVALVFLGAYLERRRRTQGRPALLPVRVQIDLTNPVHRNTAMVASVFLVLFLLGTGLGTYKAYHVTESTAFCGLLCHSVMEPEHTAYQTSPHARVACVKCHIGPGADWFVKSKMSGAYQLYATAFKKYPRPIPTPVKNLRPARETCLQCHWPEKFFGSRLNVYPHFLADEANTPAPISLLVHIGGGGEHGGRTEGIHWHMAVNNKVEYVARDEARQDIAWVRITDAQGNVTEYQDPADPLPPARRAALPTRVMDCIDCHNRPSHNYQSPLRTVNQAMESGAIRADLPYVKREAVKALDSEYASSAEASMMIERKMKDFYKENYPDLAASRAKDIDAAVAAVKGIYSRNFFPEMKVNWRVYPDHIGHFQFQGCFRCHGKLVSESGAAITGDCNACHSIMRQGTGNAPVPPEGHPFRHPVDIGGVEAEGTCWNCHTGGAESY